MAAEDAIFLARGCRKVYLIHRREELRAAMVLQEALKETPNVEILWNSVITEIRGETQVRSLCIRDVISGQERELPVDGCFIAVGITPNTQLLRDTGVELDDSGYIIAGEDGKTNVPESLRPAISGRNSCARSSRRRRTEQIVSLRHKIFS